jgi:hypothetical protein
MFSAKRADQAGRFGLALTFALTSTPAMANNSAR